MRLDKYLKVSRIIKRRTVAKEAGDSGRVQINGKPAKPSSEVQPGDVLEIRFGDRLNRYEVLEVSERAAKADASSMYRALTKENEP
jgi:ribosomal 50S subunit-recycling heat shock protein